MPFLNTELNFSHLKKGMKLGWLATMLAHKAMCHLVA